MKTRFHRLALYVFLVQFFFSSHLIAQRAHFGLWLANADSSYMAMDLSWNELIRTHQSLNSHYLQLTDIETDLKNGRRVFTGVWAKNKDQIVEDTILQDRILPDTVIQERIFGDTIFQDTIYRDTIVYDTTFQNRTLDTTVIIHSNSYENFYQRWQSLSDNGLRLTDIETYLDGSQRKYIGVYHKGNDPHDFVGKTTWKGLNADWVQKFKQDLRLVDFEMYKEGGDYVFMGVWRYGTQGQMFWGGTDWYGFTQKIEELERPGLNLIDVETFSDGSSRKYIGVWNQDSTKHYIWQGVDKESFASKWQQINGSRYSLVDFEQYLGCEEGCDNQVIGKGRFSLKLAGHKDIYALPIEEKNGNAYIDFNVISFSGRFLYLPFSEAVPAQLNKTWANNGDWTYGLTYEHEQDNSFRVRAMAEGTVIYANWDPKYGNTLVISHDYRGQKDAFRTIYTNLRNGPEQDCRLSWDNSMKYLNGPEKRAYENYLKASGCPANPKKREPSETLWGTDKNIIPRLRGKQVKLGEFLGWSGNTGPLAVSEQGTRTSPHLQVFVCRKNPKTQQWHLIDPYGIYAGRKCYPNLVDQISTMSCGYAKAWSRGKPQHPRISGGR